MTRPANISRIIGAVDLSRVVSDIVLNDEMIDDINSWVYADVAVDKYNIRDFLRREEVSSQIGIVLARYAEAAAEGNTAYYPKPKEIVSFLRSVNKDIEAEFGYRLTSSDFDEVERILTEDTNLRDYSLGGVFELAGSGNAGAYLALPQVLFSAYPIVISCVLCALFLLNTLLLHRKRIRYACLSASIPPIAVGLVFMVGALLAGPAARLLGDAALYVRMVPGAPRLLLLPGFISFGAGIILLAAFFIIKIAVKRPPAPPSEKATKAWRIGGLTANILLLISLLAFVGLCYLSVGDALEALAADTPSAPRSSDRTPSPSPSPAVQIGDIITFGDYEWRVLAVENGKALIITDKIINIRTYHNTNTSITWADCDLRAYLNGEFYNSFSAADRARIAETFNVNKDNQWFGTSGGADTTDKIFLLSLEEVVKYFGDSGQLANGNPNDARYIDDQYNGARIAYTAKAYTSSLWGGLAAGTALSWWLRSPGRQASGAADVGDDGVVYVSGSSVYIDFFGLRPALWVSLDDTPSTSPSPSSNPSPSPSPSPSRNPSPSVGDIITFGAYEWRVLTVENGRALIITDKIIDFRPYHSEWEDITWADCGLRAYLNGEFYESFSAADRARIVETLNVNKNNQWHYEQTLTERPDYVPKGGADTTDKIFLLSLEEVVKYFGDSGQLANRPAGAHTIDDRYNSARIAYTAKALPGYESRYPAGTAWVWWLRSPGNDAYNAAFVIDDGNVAVYGGNVHDSFYGLRPALWVTL
ncbi:MAG: DUF6273 domain-containing protein [Oscillospiraceae bacterium]|nr:DUF6273 domain-containing protein [Oscillospiraceae bacterium]